MKTNQPNLYIVGFMGTGKSTVGRMLAERLGLRFIDSDKHIEASEGMRVKEIFEQLGEAHFRKLERDFVDEGHPPSACVVACGGGLIVQPGMIEKLKDKGLVACLFASPETILKRTQANNARPLLQADNPIERIKALMAERDPIYLKAGICILTDHRSIGDIVSHLERFYRGSRK